jgi:hypothetical protein
VTTLAVAQGNSDTSAALTVASDQDVSGVYLAVAPGGTIPDAASIVRQGVPFALSASQSATLNLSSLSPSTVYTVYVMLTNRTSNLSSNIQASSVTTSRNPLTWPFSPTSIWNMPIGSGAVYVPANLPAVPSASDPLARFTPMPGVDEDIIVLRPTAPATDILLNTTGWTPGGDRCVTSATATSTVLANAPIPSDWVLPNSLFNNSTVFLAADSRSLIQVQPTARCAVGQAPTALAYFFRVEDLYGTGATGSHGGSFLSALGGALRVGELRPNLPPPRHALKFEVDSREVFPPCATAAACFRWPALAADTGATTTYGSMALPGVSSAMRMGALLALPAGVNINSLGLETDAAKKLAWTLQNYGAYIVDSIGGPAYNFSVESGPDGSFLTQFMGDWGFAFNQRIVNNTAWVRDVQKIIVALNVVDNNSPTTIGGGGTPLQPLAVPITAPAPLRAKRR